MAQVSLKSYENEIRDLIEIGAYDEAMEIGQHILQYYPKHLQTYSLLGESCLGKGLYQEAADLLLRVLSVDPENVAARVGLSRAYEAQGEINSAIEQMRAAFDLAPSLSNIHTETFLLLQRQSEGQAPRLKLTRQGLGRIYTRGELYTQAADEFETLLMETPDQVDIQVSLAEALWRDSQHIRAIEVCQSVLNKLPYCLKAHLILAETWLRSDREDEAEAHLKIIQELDPDGESAYVLMGAASPLPRVSVTLLDLESASEAVMQKQAPIQPTELTSLEEMPEPSELETLAADTLASPIQTDAMTEATLEFEEADIPDWLQEARPQDAAEATGTEADAIADAEIPTWLAAGAAGAAIAHKMEKDPESLDETTEIDAGESIEEIPEEGLPDWLTDAAPQEIQAETTVEQSIGTPTTGLFPGEPEEPSISNEVAAATIAAAGVTEAEEEHELPPWLRDIPEEEVPLEEAPATAADVPPETAVEEEEMPSWLQVSPDEESALEEVTVVTTELPSEGEVQDPTWLRILREEDLEDELQSEEPLAARGVAAALAAAEVLEPEDALPEPTVAVPSEGETVEAEAEKADTTAQEELGTEHVITKEELLEPETQDPTWLRILREEGLEDDFPADEPLAAMGVAAAVAAAEVSDGEDTPPAATVELPPTLEPTEVEIREVKEETDLPSQESLLEAGLIDAEIIEAEPAETPLAATSTILQLDAISEEVVPGDREISPDQPTEESRIDLLTEKRLEQMGLVHEDIATEEEALPDWLRKAALAEGLAEEITGDEAQEESAESPDWLELLQREGMSQFVMPEEPDSAEAIPPQPSIPEEEDLEIPSWLQMLRQDQQEELSLPEDQAAIPPEAATGALAGEKAATSDLITVAEATAPELVEEEPAFSAAEAEEEIDIVQMFPDQVVDEATVLNYENMLIDNPKDHATRWELIQAYANRGDQTAAIEHSEQLIRSGEFATEIISYLETLAKTGVETRRAYQTLGEAYFKQDRLQEAAEAYRKALSLLS
jgi:tetratricopeptide (TPR) repeat protein